MLLSKENRRKRILTQINFFLKQRAQVEAERFIAIQEGKASSVPSLDRELESIKGEIETWRGHLAIFEELNKQSY